MEGNFQLFHHSSVIVNVSFFIISAPFAWRLFHNTLLRIRCLYLFSLSSISTFNSVFISQAVQFKQEIEYLLNFILYNCGRTYLIQRAFKFEAEFVTIKRNKIFFSYNEWENIHSVLKHNKIFFRLPFEEGFQHKIEKKIEIERIFKKKIKLLQEMYYMCVCV